MVTGRPLLTALVSVYKAGRFLPGCLDDLLNQTVADQMEVIVIDSASPDREREIVEAYQARHPNIRYIRTEKRETLYRAWNRGIEAAAGTYLTSANADDRHAPEFAETLIGALESNPHHALAWADCWVTTEENSSWDQTHAVGRFRWPDFVRETLFRVPCIGPQPVWRRQLTEHYGYFDSTMISAGDYDYWLRLAVDQSFLHISEPLGLYHFSAGGIERSNLRQSRREAEIARKRYWDRSWGPRPRPGGSYLYWKPSFWLKQLLRGRVLPPPRPV